MIGLKRDTVKLTPHEKAWETEAKRTITALRRILGSDAGGIEHVGSTAILSICAKPIIDIAVEADSFEKILTHEQELKKAGFYYRPNASIRDQLLFAAGSYYDGTGDEQTHFIHVVHTGSMDWINYINFRNYLNKNETKAKEYEALKLSLAAKSPDDPGRKKYLAGKQEFIAETLRLALVDSFIGKTVDIAIDRPMGYVKEKDGFKTVYPINYGYIPGVFAPDGEELDVYLLGVDEQVDSYRAKIIGFVKRFDDNEDKLIAAPDGIYITESEAEDALRFQEQFFKHKIEICFH